MSIEAIKEALDSMCRAASMHDSEWTHRMGEVNDWGTQCWEIDGERVQELATAYGETTAAFIAACNPVAIRSLIERLEAAEKDSARYRGLRDSKAGDWVICAWDENDCRYFQDLRAPSVVDAAIDSAMGLSPAESAGELQAVDRSPQGTAHPGIHALDGSPAPGGLACDRLPERVPPQGMVSEGELPASDHQSGYRQLAGGAGVLGGMAAKRSDDGGLAC